MNQPKPGFPMEAVATSTAAAYEAGVGTGGEDRFHFFNARPFITTESTVASGVVQSELRDTTDAEEFRVRNVLDEDILVGDRVVFMLGADGLGVLLVKLCE